MRIEEDSPKLLKGLFPKEMKFFSSLNVAPQVRIIVTGQLPANRWSIDMKSFLLFSLTIASQDRRSDLWILDSSDLLPIQIKIPLKCKGSKQYLGVL